MTVRILFFVQVKNGEDFMEMNRPYARMYAQGSEHATRKTEWRLYFMQNIKEKTVQ